jgi:mRNA-degrading endonuclease RelE of RelBE toxin-antitoxin system
MISFKTISSFRSRLAALLKVKRKVYANVENEINREFAGKPIEQIRQNNDMILLEGDLVVVKLRLPDKKQHLSRKDGFRLIYLVSKTDEIVVFLDIYPKNGPLQQLDIADNDLKSLLKEFIEEAQSNNLLDYAIEIK